MKSRVVYYHDSEDESNTHLIKFASMVDRSEPNMKQTYYCRQDLVNIFGSHIGSYIWHLVRYADKPSIYCIINHNNVIKNVSCYTTSKVIKQILKVRKFENLLSIWGANQYKLLPKGTTYDSYGKAQENNQDSKSW